MSPKKANSAQRRDDYTVGVCSSLSYGLMSHNRDGRPLAASGAGNEIQSEQPGFVASATRAATCLLLARDHRSPVSRSRNSWAKFKGQEVPAPCCPLAAPLTLSPCSVGWGQRHYPSGHTSQLPLAAQAFVWDARRPLSGRTDANKWVGL